MSIKFILPMLIFSLFAGHVSATTMEAEPTHGNSGGFIWSDYYLQLGSGDPVNGPEYDVGRFDYSLGFSISRTGQENFNIGAYDVRDQLCKDPGFCKLISVMAQGLVDGEIVYQSEDHSIFNDDFESFTLNFSGIDEFRLFSTSADTFEFSGLSYEVAMENSNDANVSIPEPGTLGLLAAGLLLPGLLRLRKKASKSL